MLLSSVFVCTPDTWQRRSTVLGQVRVAYVQWYQFIHPPGNRKSCILLLFARRIKFLSSWWVKGLSSCPRVTGIISIFLSVWWLWLVAHGNQTSSIQLKTSQEQSESIHNIEVCSEKYVHLYSEASSSSLAHQVDWLPAVDWEAARSRRSWRS